MGKKKRKKAKPQLAPEQYAALLARGGARSLDLLTKYEQQVIADPEQWATPYGATQAEMLAGIGVLRAVVTAETLNASVAAAGV